MFLKLASSLYWYEWLVSRGVGCGCRRFAFSIIHGSGRAAFPLPTECRAINGAAQCSKTWSIIKAIIWILVYNLGIITLTTGTSDSECNYFARCPYNYSQIALESHVKPTVMGFMTSKSDTFTNNIFISLVPCRFFPMQIFCMGRSLGTRLNFLFHRDMR